MNAPERYKHAYFNTVATERGPFGALAIAGLPQALPAAHLRVASSRSYSNHQNGGRVPRVGFFNRLAS